MIVVFLLFLAGVLEGYMDWLQFRLREQDTHELYDNTFWNPINSWRNKWKFNHIGQIVDEKFWQSSRLFVFLTDGWHLMKFLRNLMFFGSLLLIAISDITAIEAVIVVVMSRITYGLGFSITFNWIHRYI